MSSAEAIAYPHFPQSLENAWLRLERMTEAALPQLWAVASGTPDLLRHQLGPKVWNSEAFCRHYASVLASGQLVPYLMRLKSEDRIVGTSAYLDIRESHRGLEIGATWIAKPWQGTVVNPAAKSLMFEWAFESWHAIRVQLKTDARNLQSQRAMEKLGLVKEGVLRRHIILTDGYLRDSVMYSAIDAEWPALKANLQQRLAAWEPQM